MLLFFLASALVLCSIEASSFPQRTLFSNKTTTPISGAAATGCANQCFRNPQPVASIWWSSMDVTATVTAETLLLVVNNRTNSTRTSTIFNTEIDPKEYAPATTNSAGTVTTSVVLQDGSTKSTRYIAYPTTGYEDYPSTYDLCGTLSTTIGGAATCLTYQSGCDVTNGETTINHLAPTFTYPSHPPLPEGIQSSLDVVRDPRGWTYLAVINYNECVGDTPISSLFPDLGVWICTKVDRMCALAGPRAKSTALFLTATSTSTEADNPTAMNAENFGPTSVTATTTPTGKASNISPPPPPVGAFLSNPTSRTPEAKPIGHGADATLNPGPGPVVDSAPVATIGPAIVSPVSFADDSKASIIALQESISTTDGQGKLLAPTDLPPPLKSPELISFVSAPAATVEPAIASSVTFVDDSKASNIALPESTSTTDDQGKLLAPTDLPPQLNTPRPSSFVPVPHTYIDAHGNAVVSTGPAAVVPVPLSSTNARGELIVSANPSSIGAFTASVPITLTSTNSQGSVITSTSYIPGIVLTTTDSYGSQLITTSPLILPLILAATNTQGFPVSTILPLSPILTAPPALTIGSHTIIANSQNQYIVDSQTLTPDGTIAVSGTTISLLPDGAKAIIGTSTERLTSRLLPAITSPTITIGSETITANSLGQYVFGSQTLTPGGTITVSGTTVSLLPNGAEALIGTSTERLLTSRLLPAITSLPAITIGSEAVTANSLGQYTFGSQTLTPAGVITVSGTRISLAPDGTEAVIGTSTEKVLSPSPPVITSAPAITIGSETVTANTLGQYMFGSQALTADGVVTVSGTRISLAPGGTEAIVGTSTESLGPYIIGGLGGGSGNGSGSTGLAFTGAATRSQKWIWSSGILVILGLTVVIWL